MLGRAKKRHSGLIQGEDFYPRPMIEKLEDRVLFNITAFELGGGGSVQEGQVAGVQLFAQTDHDWISGAQIHGHLDWGDGSAGEDVTWASETQIDLYHVYTKASDTPFTISAQVWDDPVQTYNITSSEQSQSVDVQVTDAPLSTVDPMDSLFDLTDTTTTGWDNPRGVAEFADANGYATPDQFCVLSIDWGDGTTSPDGSIQKGADGNFVITAFHPYQSANPDNIDTDGHWNVIATVMDTATGGSSGQTVAATGKARVMVNHWLNVMADCPPDKGPGPDPGNSVVASAGIGWSGGVTYDVFDMYFQDLTYKNVADIKTGCPTLTLISAPVAGQSWSISASLPIKPNAAGNAGACWYIQLYVIPAPGQIGATNMRWSTIDQLSWATGKLTVNC